nr:hypothetical protein [Tanacetum cinerariifolium]
MALELVQDQYWCSKSCFFHDILNDIGQLNIVASEDTCVWNLGPNATFTVKDARNIIDQKTLPSLLLLGTKSFPARLIFLCGDCHWIGFLTDAADNSGPIFDAEPLQKVQNDDNNYNVFDNDQEHPEQPEYVNELHLVEQDKHNIIIDSLDMSYDREQDDQDDTDDLAKECDLLAFLTEKLKCEIDDNKNCNKYLESSNKALVDKLKGEIEDFKTKNKSLESSNNHFKEANNELSKTNRLMFKDLKKF